MITRLTTNLGLLPLILLGVVPCCTPKAPAKGANVTPPGPIGAQAAAEPDPTHNLLGTNDFEDGIMLPWTTSFTPPAKGGAELIDGALCLSIEEPGKDRWDAQLRHREMVARQGRRYSLGFRAWSSRPTNITLKFGRSGPPYTDYWTRPYSLTPAPKTIRTQFTMYEPDDATVELAVHAGGSMVQGEGPIQLCFDEIVLSDPDFEPPPKKKKPSVPAIRVNQLGYLPGADKVAILVTSVTEPLPWELVDSTGTPLIRGVTLVHGRDSSSGDQVHVIDFSSFDTEARDLRLTAGPDAKSHPFSVGRALYKDLGRDALRFFYHMRSGTPIEIPYAEQERWAHPAGHLPDIAACAPRTGCSYSLDVTGGWYDAGDHGKYVVNGGFSVWMLQNAYERQQALGRSHSWFADGALNIPESSNGVPDVLDEARWQLEFMMKMQVPAGNPLAGMAHHKMHDVQWTSLATGPHEDSQKRILRPPTTAATLNLAAVLAQAARLWSSYDPGFAARCLSSAEVAWQAAKKHPALFSPPSDSDGGGAYADDVVEDEFFWAAAELLLTTGKAEYQNWLATSPLATNIGEDLVIDGEASASAVTWQRVDVLGKVSLALAPGSRSGKQAKPKLGSSVGAMTAEHVSQAEAKRYRELLIEAGERLLATAANQGYRFPMRPGPHGNYPWGSNADVLGNMVLLGAAADWKPEGGYADGLVAGLDYLLGRNALGQSYITGYGALPVQNVHHRFWSHQANPEYPPPPPGCVAGGPNSDMQDPYVIAAGLRGCALQKCYVDHIDAYSVNEVAINWNAALVWTLAWLGEGR